MAIVTNIEMKEKKHKIGYALLLILLGVWVVAQLFPMFWMVIGGFKTNNELISVKLKILPEVWQWENYVKAFTTYDIGKNFLNTFIICAAIIVIQVGNSALSAYSLSKIKPKCGNFFFMFFLGTMMFSGTALMFPLYIMMTKLGLIGSKWALILSSSAWAYCIFLFKNFFDGIPKDLFEAAEIDGCGRMGMFTRILLPLSKPVMVVCIMNTFLTVYNDFLYPLMLLPDEKDWTIMIRLYLLEKQGTVDLPVLYVMLTVATLPVVLVYLFAQKDITEGVVMSGIKG